MEIGSRLALRATILGLRRSGQLSNHALTVIIDELRIGAQQARESLYDTEARQIEELAGELRSDSASDVPNGSPRFHPRSTRS